MAEADALAQDMRRLQSEAQGLLTSDSPSAYERAAQAREEAQRQNSPRDEAISWRLMGQALRAMGRHSEAVAILTAASEAAQRAGDALLAGQVSLGRIDSLGMLGRYTEAITLALQLEQDFRELGAEEDAAKALVNAGGIHFRRDRHAEALTCYERAGAILDKSGDAVLSARVALNRANALTQLDRIEEALTLYDSAVAAFRENEMAFEAAVGDLNAGYLHHVSGRQTRALSALTRAFDTLSAAGRLHEAGRGAIDRGDAYRTLNLHTEALRDYEFASGTFEALQSDYDHARAETGRAAILLTMGRSQEARNALDSAEALFRAQRNAPMLAQIQLLRAASGVTDEARAAAGRAARIFARAGLKGWAAEARLIAATSAAASRSKTRTLREISRVAEERGRGWLQCRAERALGRHYAARGQRTTALRHFRAAVAALESVRTQIAPEEMHLAFLRDKSAVYDDLIALLLTPWGNRASAPLRDVAEALEYVERSRSRLLLQRVQQALENRPSNAGAVDPAIVTRLDALRAELSRAYYQEQTIGEGATEPGRRFFSRDTENKEDRARLAGLERDYRDALHAAELSALRESGSDFLTGRIPSVEALQAALAPGEILLEFYSGGDRVYAFCLSKDKLTAIPLAISLAGIIYLRRKLRYHLQKGETQTEYQSRHGASLLTGCQETLARLYDGLLRPLENSLCGERLIVAPHGLLHGLPFHAFFDGQRYSRERWEFLYAPSAALWYAGAQRSAAREKRRDAIKSEGAPPETASASLLMGIPAPGIEMVATEARELTGVLPNVRTFMGASATRKAFLQYAPGSACVHLATHAEFRADNPLFSGLRLADGYLLARDLYEMRLECDLVTLSACDTGVEAVEAGDELFGLVRGFLAAGARSVMASLWSAQDSATAALMCGFYARLQDGETKIAALRGAQRDLQKKYPHPYYWAAFVMVGEG